MLEDVVSFLKETVRMIEAGEHIEQPERRVQDVLDRNHRRKNLKPPRKDRQKRNLVEGPDDSTGDKDPDLNYDNNRRP